MNFVSTNRLKQDMLETRIWIQEKIEIEEMAKWNSVWCTFKYLPERNRFDYNQLDENVANIRSRECIFGRWNTYETKYTCPITGQAGQPLVFIMDAIMRQLPKNDKEIIAGGVYQKNGHEWIIRVFLPDSVYNTPPGGMPLN